MNSRTFLSKASNVMLKENRHQQVLGLHEHNLRDRLQEQAHQCYLVRFSPFYPTEFMVYSIPAFTTLKSNFKTSLATLLLQASISHLAPTIKVLGSYTHRSATLVFSGFPNFWRSLLKKFPMSMRFLTANPLSSLSRFFAITPYPKHSPYLLKTRV